MSERLSDERRNEIASWLPDEDFIYIKCDERQATAAIRDLLADNDALRADLAAARKVDDGEVASAIASLKGQLAYKIEQGWAPNKPELYIETKAADLLTRLAAEADQLAIDHEKRGTLAQMDLNIALNKLSDAERRLEALRGLPQFQNGEDITSEAISKLVGEYTDMVMTWAPVLHEIEFVDDDGNPFKIVYEDSDTGAGGWCVPEQADWKPVKCVDLDAAERRLEAARDMVRKYLQSNTSDATAVAPLIAFFAGPAMTNPKAPIDEWVETYWNAWNTSGDPDPVIRDDDVFDNIRAGLLAVIEKHVGPMLAEAHAQGGPHAVRWRSPADQEPVFPADEQYAAQRLAILKGETIAGRKERRSDETR